MTDRHRVIVIGGGFGGLSAVRGLRRADVEITLIDKHNYHLFQPLLYQVATGGLSPADIASPLRGILKRQRNVRTLLAEVIDIDIDNRQVVMADHRLEYDSLIVATGTENQYYGHDNWQEWAPGLKTIADALEIRNRVFSAFEQAELETDELKRKSLLTFVVVGGGPTGVELAGAVAEIARDTLRHDFRVINPALATIILIEGGTRVLSSFGGNLPEKAHRSLTRLGVEVWTDSNVQTIAENELTVLRGATESMLSAGTILWAAGIKATRLSKVLAGNKADTLLDSRGKVRVQPDLTLADYPEVLVLGDLAAFEDQTGETLPELAPVAISQGSFAARLISARLSGSAGPPEYSYVDKGKLATIGRAAAVADFGRLRFSGYPAWLIWLFVHLMQLVEFENRLLVFTQWAWNYITRNRGARLIS